MRESRTSGSEGGVRFNTSFLPLSGMLDLKKIKNNVSKISIKKRSLPRLPEAYYQGRVTVFWTYTTQHRARVQLGDTFHAAFRERMCHTATRYYLVCPAYCWMPDHLHFIWTGLRDSSNQLAASTFLRKHLKPLIAPALWQFQAHDHVLREDEKGYYTETVDYLLMNPVRKDLVSDWKAYPFTGCLVPGYPDLPRNAPDFHVRFERIVRKLVELNEPS